MKMYVLLMLVAALIACDRVTEMQPATTAATVPMGVVNGLAAIFPDAKQVTFSVVEKNMIWQADFQTNGSYSVLLSDQGGFYSAFRQIATDQLPTSARQTAAATPIQQAFEDITAQKTVQGYKAIVTTTEGLSTLLFDKAGGLIYTTATATTEPSKPVLATITSGTSEKTTVVYANADQLPAAVRTYIAANLAGWTFAKGVATIAAGSTQTVYVYLTNGNRWAELYFDGQGQLLKSFVSPESPKTEPKPVTTPTTMLTATKDIPQPVRETLTKTYPGWTFLKGAGDATNGYIVVIQVGTTLYYLYYDGQWKLLPEKTTTVPTTPGTGTPTPDPKPTTPTPTTPSIMPLILTDIPYAAREALTKLFPDWTFQKGIPDGTGGYLVVIASKAKLYYVTFDGRWAILTTKPA